jgi:hypothetical protein
VLEGFAAPTPWLGLLGLDAAENHLYNTITSEPSLLEGALSGTNLSLSWGYTAGARYTNPPTNGSLTLGGYDAARRNNSTSLTIPFSSSASSFQVAVTEIDMGSKKVVTSLPSYFVLDSVVPDFWLPLEICTAFESALGLVGSEKASMYLINDTQHANLSASNPEVTFSLAATESSKYTENAVNITLPYAALNLVAEYPLVTSQTLHCGTSRCRERPTRHCTSSAARSCRKRKLTLAPQSLV